MKTRQIRCACFIPGGIQCIREMYHVGKCVYEPYQPFSTHVNEHKTPIVIATVATPVAVPVNARLGTTRIWCKHQGQRRKVSVQYLKKNGVIPYQPVKIGTRFYFLKADTTFGSGFRSERACRDVVLTEVAVRLRNMY